MRMVAIFEDEPAMLAIPAARSAAHLAYLDQNRDRILIGGGLRPAPGEAYCGGLWVLEVTDRDEAVRLIENNPYFDSAIRRYKLFVWGKAFEDREIVL